MDQSNNENLNVSPSNGVVGGASDVGIVNNNIVITPDPVQSAGVNVDDSSDDTGSVVQNQANTTTEETNPFQELLDDSIGNDSDNLSEIPTSEESVIETVSSDESTEEISDEQDYTESDSSMSTDTSSTDGVYDNEIEDADFFTDSSEKYDDEGLSPYEKETIEAIAGCQQDAEVLLKVASVPLDYESATPLDRVIDVLTEEYIKRRAQYPLREENSDGDGGDNDQMKAFDHLLSTLGFVREVSEDSPETSETRIVVNSNDTALTEGKAPTVDAFKSNMDKLADDLEQEKNSLESQLANYREQCQREAEEREARVKAIQARFGL